MRPVEVARSLVIGTSRKKFSSWSAAFGGRVNVTESPARSLKHQYLVQRRPDRNIGRQIQKFAKACVARDQPATAIEHAEAFTDRIESVLQQWRLSSEAGCGGTEAQPVRSPPLPESRPGPLSDAAKKASPARRPEGWAFCPSAAATIPAPPSRSRPELKICQPERKSTHSFLRRSADRCCHSREWPAVRYRNLRLVMFKRAS